MNKFIRKTKEGLQRFWQKYGEAITTIGIAAGVIGGLAYANKKIGEAAEQRRLDDLAAQEEAKKKAEEETRRESEKEARRYEEMKNDPANQLTGGGYIDPEGNDWLYEADCPGLLANHVPLTSMGEFGQDMIKRLNETYPDWEAVGMFNPETAVADVMVDFCHAKWLAQQERLNSQEESQGKQDA